MKHTYLLAVFLLSALGQRAQAQITAWRPFRPDVVYAFAQAASPNTLHTLRTDSAYATSTGDSVYTFNRLLRQTPGTSFLYRKSRNNLLGARLRWQPGTTNFYLEANAEPTIGAAAAAALLLRPRAAVGSTWVASASPALTATLSSRSYGLVGSAPDSLATITLSNGQALLLSKHYGLVQGPQWLDLTPGSSSWVQSAPPQAALGFYNPQTLFGLGVGDELGYQLTDYAVGSGSFVCSQGYRLLRITSRQLTTDSLVLRYTSQTRTSVGGGPTCGPASTSVSAVGTGSWKFSLRTGRSAQFPYLPLLTGEYQAAVSNTLFTGRNPTTRTSGCQANARIIAFAPMYPYSTTQPDAYYGGLDNLAYLYELSPSLGVGLITLGSSIDHDYRLTYYSRGGTICGSKTDFATLLPSRAAQAAAAATLHPNPATDAATLTLNEPTQPGATLLLTDALGRQVWRTAVATNQTVLSIPLASQPAGLYLVQLLTPGAAPLTWKLQH